MTASNFRWLFRCWAQWLWFPVRLITVHRNAARLLVIPIKPSAALSGLIQFPCRRVPICKGPVLHRGIVRLETRKSRAERWASPLGLQVEELSHGAEFVVARG